MATTTRRAPARKAPKKAPTRARPSRPAWFSRADVWGGVLLVVAVLAALGIWADLAGPVGRGTRRLSARGLGGLRVTVPIALAWVGALLLRGRIEDRRRISVSLALVLTGAAGIGQLAGDGSGGALGRAVAEPLRSLAATWGAAVILLALGLTGALLFTRTSPRTAAHQVGAIVLAIVGSLRSGLRWLESVGGRDDDGSGEVLDLDEPAEATVLGLPLEEPEEADDDDTESVDLRAAVAQVRVPAGGNEPEPKQLAIELGPAGVAGTWKLPPVGLLARSARHEVDKKAVDAQGRTLEMALAAHGVETTLVGSTVGPTVTRFELELGPGVKVNRVTSLQKDIAYAMASPDVRILAPIPGRSAIGVEVPNHDRQLVALGDILTSEEARKASHPCEVALGRDISGRAVMLNLAEMPHLLIAGATGAGKSSCINSLITSLLVRSTPDQVRLILVDPKRVELGQYNGLPHLLTSVVVNPKRAANALQWAVKEMERRYDLLSEVGVRDITGYNSMYDAGQLRTEPRAEGVDDPGEPIYKRLPFIVIVVDELNDLMMVAARDVEDAICRIAQMARAVGIHLVIATQRPSVNVITGVIKANVPARLAFAVSSLADSRVILDQQGAERLIGRGDMLILGPASSIPRRVQGAWVDEDEVRKIVGHWRRQNHVQPDAEGLPPEAADDPLLVGADRGASGEDADDDELLWQAMELVVRSQLGSTSMLQRKLRVGFARAGRLMDLLEQKGVVGPSTGSKARDVLMTPEELDELLGAGSGAS
ncbi:MAG: DNA translocase FtsK [Acidobacteria bacterium]|nr:DNA translocase FtsK [Acidobacteriota bacterium]